MNDKIITACPHCRAGYRVAAGLAGKQVRCARCQAAFTVIPSGETGGPAAPAAPAGPAAPQPDQASQWIAARMLEVVCPHCGLLVPLARSFIGSHLACPRCGQGFTIAPDGTVQPPQAPLHRRLLADKRFLNTALAVAAIAGLLAAYALVSNARRESRLMDSLARLYPAPNYTVTSIDPPKGEPTVHKVADGSQKCPTAAYVHVAHAPTGMEFDRVLCEAGGQWGPTFRQRLADQAAADFIRSLEGEGDSFDPGEMPWMVYDSKASKRGELINTMGQPEEKMAAWEYGSALGALSHGQERPGTGDDESQEEEWGADGEPWERYYLAQAVMYPAQAEELFQAGKISQKP